MKTRRLMLVLVMVVAGMVFLTSGCTKEEPQSATDMVKAQVEETLCTKCGQVKGSDLCCKEDAVKCDKCGLDKGSPGCCKLPKG